MNGLENMEATIDFDFTGKRYSCRAFIDVATDPCFVFVVLVDKELTDVYGTDVTIKTDFENLIPYKVVNSGLEELKRSVFNAIKETPEFVAVKQKTKQFARKNF